MAWVTALSQTKASLVLLLLSSAAFAEDRTNWEYLYDHLLIEALDGNMDVSSRAYQELGRNLPDDDPTRSEALYWLGRSSYAQGNNKKAQTALRDGVRMGNQRRRSLELLGQMALEETSVTKTPTEWTFDNGAHGFVHPWRHMDKGSISVKDGYLLWTTTAAQQDEDELVVGFNHPTPGPKGVRISLSSFINDAYLSVTFSDTTNQLFEHTAPILLERSTEDRTIDIPFATLKGAKSGLPPDPKQIDRLTIQNQSGRNAISGLNEIHIAHFSVY